MKTRGRLSQIDLLPKECDGLVAWVIYQVKKQQMSQLDLRAKLNEGLKRAGITRAISKSAFNRWVTAGLSDGFAPRAGDLDSMNAAVVGTVCPHCGKSLAVGGVR